MSRMLRRGNVLEVRVHPDDLGKVIGRGGRTARALRTVIGSLAGNRHVRIDLLETGEVRYLPCRYPRPESAVRTGFAAMLWSVPVPMSPNCGSPGARGWTPPQP